jgi:hypothetical protein
MSRVIALVACGFTLAACSASLSSLSFLGSSPPTETLRIESEPSGAEAKTSLGQSCRTPCELVMQAADEFSLTLALNGYQPQTVSVRKDAEKSQLAPNPVYAQLQPVPVTPAKKHAAPKKKPAVAARPATAQSASAQPAQPAQAAAPSAAPPAQPAPAVEAAASATNYPWPSR